MGKVPYVITFWWDFHQPGEMPLKLESNHPHLPDVLATFDGEDAVERADAAVQKLSSGIDIHPCMSADRILCRVNNALKQQEEANVKEGE